MWPSGVFRRAIDPTTAAHHSSSAKQAHSCVCVCVCVCACVHFLGWFWPLKTEYKNFWFAVSIPTVLRRTLIGHQHNPATDNGNSKQRASRSC